MTTPTDTHIRIARDAGYVGVEVRAERLLNPAASDELHAAAALVRYWTEDPIDVARRGLALTEQVIGATAPS
jgi:hypothetical protein